MEALIPALVAAALAETGGRMQRLAAALVVRFARPGAVIAGLALAAAINMGLAAALGRTLAAEIPHSAARLLLGLALAFAGIGGLFRPKPSPDVAGWRLGAWLSAAGAALILGFGEAAQFVALALAAASDEPVPAAIGAAAGVTIACVPAALFADRWEGVPFLAALRIAASVPLAIAGAVIAVIALQIV